MARRRYKQFSARSKEILAEKRRAAKILREAGLLRRRSGRITREYLQSSSYFRKLRREFADVISGEVRAAQIDLNAARLFRSAGYRVKRAPGGKARVIVPTATPRVTPRTAPRIALQPPPTAPRSPRPRAPRAPRAARPSAAIDQVVASVVEYFRANMRYGSDIVPMRRNNRIDGRYERADDLTSEERITRLIELIYLYPNVVLQIVRNSQADAERYRQGLGPIHQQDLPTGPLAELFKSEFPELYYYYHSMSLYFPAAA